MHYLSVYGISKNFSNSPLFKDLTLHIQAKSKIAIVARNGMGKTTLLKIIAGRETPDSGSVQKQSDLDIIYVEQENHFQQNTTVTENIYAIPNNQRIKVVNEYKLATRKNDSRQMEKLFTEMEEVDGWTLEADVKKIMTKLDIIHLQNRILTSLSGGQLKRVALAKSLVEVLCASTKTLLLMDEPTNHLDIEMVKWLEKYLNKLPTALLLVTHDRYFLDATCSEVWELDKAGFHTYKGSYNFFLEQKALRLEGEKSTISKARNQYKKELDWMRKQPQARTTKSKSRIEKFYKIEAQAKTQIKNEFVQLNVKANRLGSKIVEMKQVSKAYQEHKVLDHFSYTFNKGDRIGLIGKNGVGKTTFLNMIQGIEPNDSGTIKVGETVTFGYYRQKELTVKEDIRVINYVKNIANFFSIQGGTNISAAKFLEMFLFPPEKQYTFVNSLSGGEKRRLQLLSILFTNPNFLILDEPTNDFDLETLMVLEAFLQDFEGCILLVTHDRYFMDKVVNHIFVLKAEGEMKNYPGNYAEYLVTEIAEKQKANHTYIAKKVETSNTKKISKRKLSFKEKHELEQIEKEIALLEKDKANTLEKLQRVNQNDYKKVNEFGERVRTIITQIEAKESKWLALQDKQ